MRNRIILLATFMLTACGAGQSGKDGKLEAKLGEAIPLSAIADVADLYASDCRKMEQLSSTESRGHEKGRNHDDDDRDNDDGDHDDRDKEEHSRSCKRKHSKDMVEGERCLKICHRPPGNPEKAKTLFIPVSAVVAHLKHGSHGHRDRDEYEADVLGDCQQVPAPEPVASPTPAATPAPDATPVPDVSPTPAGTGSSGGANYCDPVLPNDLDCDGLDDVTGEPLY